MAGRVQQDVFIDDDDETCPLCVEELDLSDKNFRPCPCGYQVCQFCYNNIKNQMNGLCPACRRPYDDQSIEWKVISPEEQKADIALQARKKAQARKKETEQKQVDTTNRKHLAGLRVVQKNLVYVVGLNQKSSEHEFLQTLRGPQYFGQYGNIKKIVVSKAKEGHNNNNSVGVYVTFESKEDATRCIAAVDGSQNLDRPLRAQYGTTKYCSAFLRNEICGNRHCTFLHEAGEDSDSFSRQDLSSMNALSTQRPVPPSSSSKAPINQPPQSQPLTSQTAPSLIHSGPTQSARAESMSRSDSGDGPGLPSSATWATKNQNQDNRRSSKPASIADSSPALPNSSLLSASADPPQTAEESELSSETSGPQAQTPAPSFTHQIPKQPHPLEAAMKTLTTSSYKFKFNRSMFEEEQLKEIDACPDLFDDYGGLRRWRRQKEEEQKLQQEEEKRNALSAMSTVEEDEPPTSGSLQLGGEPETQDDTKEGSGRMSTQPRSAIQPPFGSSSAFSFAGSNYSAQNPSLPNRTLTPQQQQQLTLLRSQSSRQSPISNNQFQSGFTGNTSLHHHQQSNPFQIQSPPFGTNQGHTRQASKFDFANDSTSASTSVKPIANPQTMAQQSAMMPSNQGKYYQNQGNQQQNVHGNHFYGGVQGPPPGLKSSGTPPISGGGMFGQGHGFASAMGGSGGFSNNFSSKTSNDELMRELLRARNGSVNGQGPDVGKLDLADPSILQARMHHGAAGQGQFGAQGQGGFNPNNMLYGGGFGNRWQM